MKHLLVVGAFAATLTASPVLAQAGGQKSAPPEGQGHTAPKAQPATAAAPTAPAGDIALGTVRISKAVKADGKPLAAGTYVVRVTSQTASPDATGQTKGLERWVEFVQGGQVKGREVVTIVPQAEVGQVQKDAPPRPNGSKFETLRGGDYARLWINRGGHHYLVHFPT